MIPMRKTYEVVGYAYDGALYCLEHAPDEARGEDGSPVPLEYAGDGVCDVLDCGRLDGEPMPIPEAPHAFVRGYIECLMWLGDPCPTEGETTDLREEYSIEDLAPGDRDRVNEVCNAFVYANRADLDAARETGLVDWLALGADLALTQNRHGAGYWDEGLPDELGRRLSDAAYAEGEAHIYADDGQLFYHG